MKQKENDAIVVFTARSPERIVKEGGSQAWVRNPARAKCNSSSKARATNRRYLPSPRAEAIRVRAEGGWRGALFPG